MARLGTSYQNAGTGLVGLACAALGAGEALLTDLPYALRNLEANVARNEAALARTGCRVRVQEGDWFKPPSLPPDPSDNAAAADLGPVDVIVAADVVWLDELVPPFAAYLRAVLHRPGSRHAGRSVVDGTGLPGWVVEAASMAA